MLDRLAEVPPGLVEGLQSRLVQQVDTLEQCRMRLRNDGAGRGEAALFLRRERRLDLAADRERHVGLEAQHVGERLGVALRPEVLVGGAADQLCGDADVVAALVHRTLDQAVDTELAGDLWQRLLRPFVQHGRGA